MTGRDLLALLDRPAQYPVGALIIEVMITDTRTRFGTTDVLIVPVAGSGERWVSLDSVKI